MRREIIMVTMPMENIWPRSRMVAAEPEARPRWRFSTELMMAFILGEENRANPHPRKIRLHTIKKTGEEGLRKDNASSPAQVMDMPVVAKILGSTRSESRPANGDPRAIMMGWEIRMIPVVWGESPLIYWR